MLLALVFFSAPLLGQGPCPSEAALSQARALYEQAQGAPAEAAVPLLDESVAACAMFQNYALLAYQLLALERYGDAQAAANEAVGRADSPDNLVKGWWLVARARQGQNDAAGALAAYEAALQHVPGSAPPWLLNDFAAFEEALYAKGPLPAATIARALGALRSTGAMPRLALRVEFEFDSAALTASGQAQVREMVAALATPGTREYRVRLVGHTDERGAEDYNQRLSQRRAQSVATELTRLDAALAERVQAEGRGERQPRARNAQTETHHALNRRVELELEGRR